MVEICVPVRVKPGASRAKVGGRFGDDELIVAVHAPPVDGAANDAVLRALTDALGLRPRQARIVSGHTARSKLVQLDVANGDVGRVHTLLQTLLGPIA